MRTSANQESNRLEHNPDYAACASLFSIEHEKTKEFLDTLEIRTLKTAFKNKARQYQSDPHSEDGNDVILKRREQFAKIKRAYEHLFIKLQKKKTSTCTKDKTIKKQRPRIIAIGGGLKTGPVRAYLHRV